MTTISEAKEFAKKQAREILCFGVIILYIPYYILVFITYALMWFADFIIIYVRFLLKWLFGNLDEEENHDLDKKDRV